MSQQYLEWLYYHLAYMQILAGKTFEKPKGRLIFVLGGFQTSHIAYGFVVLLKNNIGPQR